MRFLGAVAWLLASVVVMGQEVGQTDWSGGPGAAGPVAAWDDRFHVAEDVAWRAVPGQLALAAQPAETTVEHTIDGDLERPFGLHAIDIDGDGDMDVVGGAGVSGVVALWLNDGEQPPTFTRQMVDGDFPGASGVFAADIDGDGRTDVVAAAEMPGNRVAWWRNDGNDPIIWTLQLIDRLVPVACSVDAADVNGDGRTDVLSVSWVLGLVLWWENSGDDPIEWTRHTIDAALAGSHSVQAVDVDQDGDLDVVAAGGECHEIAWWRNDGGEPVAWSRQTICADCVGARMATVADLDGDGRRDVIGGAFDHRLSWWRNQGGDPILWSEQSIDGRLRGLHYVHVTDLEGDGDLDVLSASSQDSQITWFANQGGEPIVWAVYPVRSDFTTAATVVTADLDGDGGQEVLGSSVGLGRFSWWEVLDFVPDGELVSAILDLGAEPGRLFLEWDATVADGSFLSFEVAAADEPDQVGEWLETVAEPGALGVVGRYVQYRAIFGSTDANVSPVLREVRLAVHPDAGGYAPRVPSGRVGP